MSGDEAFRALRRRARADAERERIQHEPAEVGVGHRVQCRAGGIRVVESGAEEHGIRRSEGRTQALVEA